MVMGTRDMDHIDAPEYDTHYIPDGHIDAPEYDDGEGEMNSIEAALAHSRRPEGGEDHVYHARTRRWISPPAHSAVDITTPPIAGHVTQTAIELKWAPNPVATKYHLQYSKNTSFDTWKTLSNNITETNYVVGGLVPGQSYIFQLRAAYFKEGTWGAFSKSSDPFFTDRDPAMEEETMQASATARWWGLQFVDRNGASAEEPTAGADQVELSNNAPPMAEGPDEGTAGGDYQRGHAESEHSPGRTGYEEALSGTEEALSRGRFDHLVPADGFGFRTCLSGGLDQGCLQSSFDKPVCDLPPGALGLMPIQAHSAHMSADV
jgi:hypothetical protein